MTFTLKFTLGKRSSNRRRGRARLCYGLYFVKGWNFL